MGNKAGEGESSGFLKWVKPTSFYFVEVIIGGTLTSKKTNLTAAEQNSC